MSVIDRRSFLALLNRKGQERTYAKFGQVGPAPRTCRYIEGEPAGIATVYCGARVQQQSSYCSEHHARCYTPWPKQVAKKPLGWAP